MSVLRTCRHALPRRTIGVSSSFIRALSSESSGTPAQAPEGQQSEVTPAPEREIVTADVVSGAPTELRHRAVRIFQPTRSTTQSGTSKSDRWSIDWDILSGAGRWENPLMGWASSADYMQGTRLSFRSKEDAIHFAEKQGWDYLVQAPEIKRIPPKNYAENYLYQPNKLRLVRTK
ncbi:uncharacterized protein LAESUDRAFT_756787 [Laetiporus sulphureus 93-53]|uniref:NADH dehydrogenase [ubiquinone] iron-sulfur protein 4, mitochondrial n=1 Tax=Laetiporus sulphureus 93-53 TaxID=1314785 RepID=A0A165FLB3_9APHY|nr:uncharacterized protein LAESUDRAFT_756787 [Laetiporus sulphureus 93-53]KZT09142.1 hypothetical protein LAESUDRAFT_756787 [Laetiporus sulphureus 93-53]